MRKLLVAFALLFILALISTSHASVEVLRPGQSTNINGRIVVCDGGSSDPMPRHKWMCSCHTPSGKNVGFLYVFASDEEQAMREGRQECRRKYRDYSLDTSAGCTKTNW